MIIEMYEGFVDLIIENQRFLEVLSVWILTMAVFVFSYLYGKEKIASKGWGDSSDYNLERFVSKAGEYDVLSRKYKLSHDTHERLQAEWENKANEIGIAHLEELTLLQETSDAMMDRRDELSDNVKDLELEVGQLKGMNDNQLEMIEGLKDEALGLNKIINDFTEALDKAHALQDNIRDEGNKHIDGLRTEVAQLMTSKDSAIASRDDKASEVVRVKSRLRLIEKSHNSLKNASESLLGVHESMETSRNNYKIKAKAYRLVLKDNDLMCEVVIPKKKKSV